MDHGPLRRGAATPESTVRIRHIGSPRRLPPPPVGGAQILAQEPALCDIWRTDYWGSDVSFWGR